jgi:protocatechuate 3,4-dioxygenase, alpha subunit
MTELGLTPSQTAGPYLEIGLLHGPIGAELVDPGDPRAIRIHGQLLDGEGEPVPDGAIEIWQANAAGRYRHEADGRDDVPLEDDFVGFGRCGTMNEGRFEFVTLKPGRVPWPGGGVQAPHVGVIVFARGLLKQAVTRVYFPDEEEANVADPVLARLTPGQRTSLIAVPENGGLRFDIRLQGPSHTTFFAV